MGEMYSSLALQNSELDQRANRSGQADMNLSMSAGGPNLEEELNIDKNTLETLRELYRAKEIAVSKEDFD